eukprot:Hpha_TRINITY_DN20174_c0_g1::TRINITY_DN20174_c0_g1_i1::g.82542::m.82542
MAEEMFSLGGGSPRERSDELFMLAPGSPKNRPQAPTHDAPTGSVLDKEDYERRIDPSDGEAYTKEEFLMQYGGYTEWDEAGEAAKAAAAPKVTPAQEQPERRIRKSRVTPPPEAVSEWGAVAMPPCGYTPPQPQAQAAPWGGWGEAEQAAWWGGKGGKGGEHPPGVEEVEEMMGEFVPGPQGGEGELRFSPKNGRAYDIQQFHKFFGGNAEWEMAEPAPPGFTFGQAKEGPAGGDWTCTQCGWLNFATRDACFTCGAPGGPGVGGKGAGFSPY